ncbi:MAG: hypothetical protein V4719_06195 [Planctomycetota bacterium]
MPRSIPPHLLALVLLLVFLLWVILVHHFRRNKTVQKFFAEAIGDDTPENALRTFEMAKLRLTKHLNRGDLDLRTRQQIELALGEAPTAAATDSPD